MNDAPLWHTLGAAEALEALGSAPEGLSDDVAAERLARYGPNRLRPPAPVSPWRILLAQFRSVIVALLAVAAIAALLLDDPVDAAAIAAVLALNAIIGFVVELRANRAMEALIRFEAHSATVLRGGRARDIDAAQLVPGDVIVLEAGDAVPADARLIEAADLRTIEAPLTGESMPVEKDAAWTGDADTPLPDRVSLVFSGTTVASGTARALVFGTGGATELGRVGRLVGGIEEGKTPLERRLDTLGRRLVWVGLAVAALVALIGVLRDEEMVVVIQTAIALAVAAVPEGLPAVSTITLAVGLRRMARRNALVRRLHAVEALGSTTIVCTDKTGTLTKSEMTVTSLRFADAEVRVTGSGYAPGGELLLDGRRVERAADARVAEALRIAALSARASVTYDSGEARVSGDPTDAALLVFARKGHVERAALLGELPLEGELPFSSERLITASLHRDRSGLVAFVKGAPGRVLERSRRVLTPQGERPLDQDTRRALAARNEEMAAAGLRVIALARAPVASVAEADTAELTFVGLAGLSDPPAPGVKDTIALLRGAGIRTLMITGDQRLTAAAISGELGLGEGEAVDGREIARMGDAELVRRAPHVTAFSRVSPEDKLRIVTALQQRGEIVAMLGDGVNDAAALKKADVGVAMGGRGTDVAREVASVVLQDDRFPTVAAAVEEGRVIYDNIRKFIFFLFSCNLAEVLILLVTGAVGLPIALLPLQILWLNLLTDTFPALALAFEPPESGVMKRPPRDPHASLLSAGFVRQVTFFAGLITASSLAAYLWALQGAGTGAAYARTMAFMTLALAQLFHLGNARSREAVLAPRRALANPFAIGAVILVFVLQLVSVYWPPLAGILETTPLAPRDWLIVLPLSLLPAVVGQALRLARGRARV